MRVGLNGGKPELVASGFRNPFGIAFAPDGRLFVTDNAYDERGSRPVFGSGDYLWQVTDGGWYGWPDFAGGRPVDAERFTPPGKKALVSLLADLPAKPPSRPAAEFGVHSSSNGFDFARNPAFGHVGQAFVAQFGDMAPAVGKVLSPVGFKVVRVDPATGVVTDFATNADDIGPASAQDGKGGFERPIAARFNPDGDALYVVDYGVLVMKDRKASVRKHTGVLWRIERTR
jgi:glucose/arabinose dehydrogenase